MVVLVGGILMIERQTLYDILGVDEDANQETLKHAYRRLARQWNPAVCPDPRAKERLDEIGRAYRLLRDPRDRQLYDANLRRRWLAEERRETSRDSLHGAIPIEVEEQPPYPPRSKPRVKPPRVPQRPPTATRRPSRASASSSRQSNGKALRFVIPTLMAIGSIYALYTRYLNREEPEPPNVPTFNYRTDYRAPSVPDGHNTGTTDSRWPVKRDPPSDLPDPHRRLKEINRAREQKDAIMRRQRQSPGGGNRPSSPGGGHRPSTPRY